MIILASTSATRQTMLRNAGVEFNIVPPDVDERDLVRRHPHWSPAETASSLAEAKALDVSRRIPTATVVGADQVLALGLKLYSKPSSLEQCRQTLTELRGKIHSLISSAVCARDGKVVWSHTAEALLTMRAFSDEFLEHYLQEVGADCMTSVGGYKIEGAGLQLFEEVKGDHFTILGLPLLPLLRHMRSTGELLS